MKIVFLPIDGNRFGVLRDIIGLHDNDPEEPGLDDRVEGRLEAAGQRDLLTPHKAGAGVAVVKPEDYFIRGLKF